MEDDIQNYLPTVMFRGTPCSKANNFPTTIGVLENNINIYIRILLDKQNFHSL